MIFKIKAVKENGLPKTDRIFLLYNIFFAHLYFIVISYMPTIQKKRKKFTSMVTPVTDGL